MSNNIFIRGNIRCKPIKSVSYICPIDGREFTGDATKINPLTLLIQCRDYTNKLEEQIKMESRWNYKFKKWFYNLVKK